jgi:hypothetical protein
MATIVLSLSHNLFSLCMEGSCLHVRGVELNKTTAIKQRPLPVYPSNIRAKFSPYLVDILKYTPPSFYLLDSSGLVNIWRMRVLNFCKADVLLNLTVVLTSLVNILKFPPPLYFLDTSGLVNIWRMRVLNFCMAAIILNLAIGPTFLVNILKFTPPPPLFTFWTHLDW